MIANSRKETEWRIEKMFIVVFVHVMQNSDRVIRRRMLCILYNKTFKNKKFALNQMFALIKSE